MYKSLCKRIKFPNTRNIIWCGICTETMWLLCLLFFPVAIPSISDIGYREKSPWKTSDETEKLSGYRSTKIARAAEHLSGQELIHYVNSHQTLWKAGPNKFDSYSDHVKYGLLGVNHVKLSVKDKKQLSPTRYLNIRIPESFDAREYWSDCASLKTIRDQSSCGSCWAFGAVEAMSDRICIATKGKKQVMLSADDLLSCCKSCGAGCQGGFTMEAWRYWVSHGIVTGSNFTQHEGCRPYSFPPCEHHNNKTHYQPCKHDLYPTPKCEKKCIGSYGKAYKDDIYYGKRAYAVENDVESIQKEIMMRGPVEAAFEVYTDFLSYVSGIYKHTAGFLGGGHAVKILGWGVDQEVPYWLVANSWNTDWGENGYFRILRGVDECGIESGIVAGEPKLTSMPDFRSKGKYVTD